MELRAACSETRLLARLRQRMKEQQPSQPGRQTHAAIVTVRQAHNTIDRLTGTTPENGGLYFMDEDWRRDTAAEFDVYAAGEMTSTELQGLFDAVGEFGYGRDANLGRGRFTAAVAPIDSRLIAHDGNRQLSLSHGTITANMAVPFYKPHTHYGKLVVYTPVANGRRSSARYCWRGRERLSARPMPGHLARCWPTFILITVKFTRTPGISACRSLPFEECADDCLSFSRHAADPNSRR
ncbi:MAG: hypothetical protein IPK63_22685 [Candidatus Competibacteraceae bacterium]|nr:hypothetical protein [Candidatus Competibacteraceae bacterium]